MSGNIDYIINKDGSPGERWNPYVGCRDDGECPIYQKCWANLFSKRLSGTLPDIYDPEDPFKPQFIPMRYDEPMDREKPTAYYVSFMGDLFGDWNMDDQSKKEIRKILDICRKTPHHRYIFLTKRPGNAQPFEFTSNCWLGTSINSKDDLNRIRDLASLPGIENKFLSIEPAINKIGFNIKIKIKEMMDEHREKPKPDWAIIGGWSKKDNSDLEMNVTNITYHLSLLDIPIWHKDNLPFGHMDENPLWEDW